MTPRAGPYRWEDLPLEKVSEMVARKVLSGAEHTIVQAYLKKGALVARHAHPCEQSVYVLQGALRLSIDGAESTLRDGDILVIPADAPHQAEAIDDTFLVSLTAFGRSG
jgi:quercetin dioxygenase-like cupin family protein